MIQGSSSAGSSLVTGALLAGPVTGGAPHVYGYHSPSLVFPPGYRLIYAPGPPGLYGATAAASSNDGTPPGESQPAESQAQPD